MGKRVPQQHWLNLQPGNVVKENSRWATESSGADKRVRPAHLEMNFMTIPKDVGHGAEVSKTSLGVDAPERILSQRCPAREMGRLTCDESEVEDLLSEGEST